MKELVTLAALRRARSRRIKLGLRRSGLENFSAPPAQLERVVELDLAYNAFRNWPLAGLSLLALETLNLAANELRDLETASTASFALPSLKSLTLDYNPLGRGFTGLLGMRELRSLSLASCGLRALPEVVCELSELRSIELSNNQIQVLPDSFARLDQLERLGLRGNPLRSIDVLASLQRLERVEVDFMAEPEALAFLRRLAQRGVRVDIREASYQVGATTPLQLAAMRGDLEGVMHHMTSESMSSLLDYPEHSLLDIACLRGDLTLARGLCDAGMSTRHSLSRRYPSTPLHQACSFAVGFCQDPTEWKPRVELIRYLVSQGADVEARDFAGLTPLHRACQMGIYSAWGRSDLAAALVEAGANVDAKSSRGESAIQLAVQLGDLRTATTLLSLGANIASNDPGLAHVAAHHGHARLCEVLLDTGAPAVDSRGRTVHHAAAATEAPGHRVDPRRRADVIERLGTAGVAVDHQDARGKTALHEACASSDLRLVAQLLRLSAQLDRRDDAGDAPLHVALRVACASPSVSLQILEKLLEAGADPNLRDGSGDTPLHRAARARHGPAARLLLRFGASDRIGNDAGETPETMLIESGLTRDALPPLHLAACQGQRARAATLIARGRFDVNATDARGRTPLFYAHRVDTARLLLRLGADSARLDADGRTADVVLSEKKKLAAANVVRAAREDLRS